MLKAGESLNDAADTIEQIEKAWYMVDPKPDQVAKDLLIALCELGDKDKNKKAKEVDLKGCHYKHLVRSFRAGLQTIVDNSKEEFIEDPKEALKDLIKKSIKITIEEFSFEIRLKPNPGTLTYDEDHYPGQLGNCHIKDVGKYIDIWPFLSLITDCDAKNNSVLADKFLRFAKGAFSFDEDDLAEINPKFNKPKFLEVKSSLLKRLTGIAFLYTFMEPARRLEPVINDNKVRIRPITFKDNHTATYASSMIVALKTLKAGGAEGEVTLQSVFSPEANLVVFTKYATNPSDKRKSLQRNVTAQLGIAHYLFFSGKNKKEAPTLRQIKNIILDPDDGYSSDDSTESKGKYNKIKPTCNLL